MFLREMISNRSYILGPNRTLDFVSPCSRYDVCVFSTGLNYEVGHHDGEYVNGDTNCREQIAAERKKRGYSLHNGPDDLTLRTGLMGVHYI